MRLVGALGWLEKGDQLGPLCMSVCMEKNAGGGTLRHPALVCSATRHNTNSVSLPPKPTHTHPHAPNTHHCTPSPPCPPPTRPFRAAAACVPYRGRVRGRPKRHQAGLHLPGPQHLRPPDQDLQGGAGAALESRPLWWRAEAACAACRARSRISGGPRPPPPPLHAMRLPARVLPCHWDAATRRRQPPPPPLAAPQPTCPARCAALPAAQSDKELLLDFKASFGASATTPLTTWTTGTSPCTFLDSQVGGLVSGWVGGLVGGCFVFPPSLLTTWTAGTSPCTFLDSQVGGRAGGWMGECKWVGGWVGCCFAFGSSRSPRSSLAHAQVCHLLKTSPRSNFAPAKICRAGARSGGAFGATPTRAA